MPSVWFQDGKYVDAFGKVVAVVPSGDDVQADLQAEKISSLVVPGGAVQFFNADGDLIAGIPGTLTTQYAPRGVQPASVQPSQTVQAGDVQVIKDEFTRVSELRRLYAEYQKAYGAELGFETDDGEDTLIAAVRDGWDLKDLFEELQGAVVTSNLRAA